MLRLCMRAMYHVSLSVPPCVDAGSCGDPEAGVAAQLAIFHLGHLRSEQGVWQSMRVQQVAAARSLDNALVGRGHSLILPPPWRTDKFVEECTGGIKGDATVAAETNCLCRTFNLDNTYPPKIVVECMPYESADTGVFSLFGHRWRTHEKEQHHIPAH